MTAGWSWVDAVVLLVVLAYAVSGFRAGLIVSVSSLAGFIGGGAILKQGASVKGTATAASLWATGAIGTAVGLGSYGVATMIAVFTVVTLKWLTPLKAEAREGGADTTPESDEANTVQR